MNGVSGSSSHCVKSAQRVEMRNASKDNAPLLGFFRRAVFKIVHGTLDPSIMVWVEFLFNTWNKRKENSPWYTIHSYNKIINFVLVY